MGPPCGAGFAPAGLVIESCRSGHAERRIFLSTYLSELSAEFEGHRIEAPNSLVSISPHWASSRRPARSSTDDSSIRVLRGVRSRRRWRLSLAFSSPARRPTKSKSASLRSSGCVGRSASMEERSPAICAEPVPTSCLRAGGLSARSHGPHSRCARPAPGARPGWNRATSKDRPWRRRRALR